MNEQAINHLLNMIEGISFSDLCRVAEFTLPKGIKCAEIERLLID
jgi:hypothetical protein